MNEKTVALVKAIAEPGMIRTMAELTGDAMSVADLCQRLALEPDVVGSHLQQIGPSGILATERVSRDRTYRIDMDRLRQLANSLEDEIVPTSGRVPPQDIAQFFRAERLERMPAQHSRQLKVLEFLIDDFEMDCDYPEVDVNAVIARRNADFATIRRAFIDEGFMTRAANVYRRTGPSTVE